MQEGQPVNIDAIDHRINEIKAALCALGPIRPGNLSQQYHNAKERRRPYWQISYTHKGKSRTDYIREPLVDDLRVQVEEYAKFRKLTQEWVDLAIERSRAEIADKKSRLPRPAGKRLSK